MCVALHVGIFSGESLGQVHLENKFRHQHLKEVLHWLGLQYLEGSVPMNDSRSSKGRSSLGGWACLRALASAASSAAFLCASSCAVRHMCMQLTQSSLCQQSNVTRLQHAEHQVSHTSAVSGHVQSRSTELLEQQARHTMFGTSWLVCLGFNSWDELITALVVQVKLTLRFLAYRRLSKRILGSADAFFTGSSFSSSVKSSGR